MTADRLGEAVERWPGRFTADETNAAQSIAHRLHTIAAHDRTDTETGWRCSCGAAVALAGVGKAELDRLFNEHAPPPPTADPAGG